MRIRRNRPSFNDHNKSFQLEVNYSKPCSNLLQMNNHNTINSHSINKEKDLQNQLKIIMLKKKYLNEMEEEAMLRTLRRQNNIQELESPVLLTTNNQKFDRRENRYQPIQSLKNRLEKSLEKFNKPNMYKQTESHLGKFTYSQTRPQLPNKNNDKENIKVRPFQESKIIKNHTPRSYAPEVTYVKQNRQREFASWLHFLKQQINIDNEIVNYVNVFPLQLASIIVQLESTYDIELIKCVNSGIQLKQKEVKDEHMFEANLKNLKMHLYKMRQHWQKRKFYKIEKSNVGLKSNSNLMTLKSIKERLRGQFNKQLNVIETNIVRFRYFKDAQILNIEEYNENCYDE